MNRRDKRIRFVNNWKMYATWGNLSTETDQKRIDLILAAFPKLTIADWIVVGKESPRNLHMHTLLTTYGDLLDTLEYCEHRGIIKILQEPDRIMRIVFENVAQASAYQALLIPCSTIKPPSREHKGTSLIIKTNYNDYLSRFEDIVGVCHSPRAASYLINGFKAAQLKDKIKFVKKQIEKKLGGSIALLDLIFNNT